MRYLMTSFLLLILAIPVVAQENYGVSGLQIRTGNSYYFDLSSKATAIQNDWGLMGGIRLGYQFNPNLKMGLAAYGLIPEQIGGNYINRGDRDILHMGYGGLEVLYSYPFAESWDVSGNLLIGSGRVDMENLGGNDYFFVAEPGISVNYDIARWFGLGAGTSYLFASGIDYAALSNNSLSSWTFSLDFKFAF